MPPLLNLPPSLLELLSALRPCFTAPGFRTFCALAAALAAQPRRRTVTGMLLGAGLGRAWPHDRAHSFFARARWDPGDLGLAAARLAVALLVPPGWPLRAAADDTVFRRSGPRSSGRLQHDGSSPARDKRSYGCCFVVVALLVRLPFCSRDVALPVLARLRLPGRYRGGLGRPTPPWAPARSRSPRTWSPASPWPSPVGPSTSPPTPPTRPRAPRHARQRTWPAASPAPPCSTTRPRPRPAARPHQHPRGPDRHPRRRRRRRALARRHRRDLPGPAPRRRAGRRPLPVVRLLARPPRPPGPGPPPRHRPRLRPRPQHPPARQPRRLLTRYADR